MTPPLSISAIPRFTRAVPTASDMTYSPFLALTTKI